MTIKLPTYSLTWKIALLVVTNIYKEIFKETTKMMSYPNYFFGQSILPVFFLQKGVWKSSRRLNFKLTSKVSAAGVAITNFF